MTEISTPTLSDFCRACGDLNFVFDKVLQRRGRWLLKLASVTFIYDHRQDATCIGNSDATLSVGEMAKMQSEMWSLDNLLQVANECGLLGLAPVDCGADPRNHCHHYVKAVLAKVEDVHGYLQCTKMLLPFFTRIFTTFIVSRSEKNGKESLQSPPVLVPPDNGCKSLYSSTVETLRSLGTADNFGWVPLAAVATQICVPPDYNNQDTFATFLHKHNIHRRFQLRLDGSEWKARALYSHKGAESTLFTSLLQDCRIASLPHGERFFDFVEDSTRLTKRTLLVQHPFVYAFSQELVDSLPSDTDERILREMRCGPHCGFLEIDIARMLESGEFELIEVPSIVSSSFGASGNTGVFFLRVKEIAHLPLSLSWSFYRSTFFDFRSRRQVALELPQSNFSNELPKRMCSWENIVAHLEKLPKENRAACTVDIPPADPSGNNYDNIKSVMRNVRNYCVQHRIRMVASQANPASYIFTRLVLRDDVTAAKNSVPSLCCLDDAIIEQAITPPQYEPLEFVGDAVLGYLIAKRIAFGEDAEPEDIGTEVDRRASNANLWACLPAPFASLLKEHFNISHNKKLADVYEALVGALFISLRDGDWQQACQQFLVETHVWV